MDMTGGMDGHHGHHGHHGGAMGAMDMPMMNMMGNYFTSRTTSDFLFQELSINSSLGICIAMIATCCLAILNDVIIYVTYLKSSEIKVETNRKTRFLNNVRQTLLKTVTVIIGYVVMLAVMTFNSWILASAVVGSGVGYFIGRPILSHFLYAATENEVRLEASEKLLHDFHPTNERLPNYTESVVKV